MQWCMEEEFQKIQCSWEAKKFQILPSCTILKWQQDVIQNGQGTMHTKQLQAETGSRLTTATQPSSDAMLIIIGKTNLGSMEKTYQETLSQ